jgi:hypothetical protein
MQNGDGMRVLARQYNSLRITESPKNLPVPVTVLNDRYLEKLRDIIQGFLDVHDANLGTLMKTETSSHSSKI